MELKELFQEIDEEIEAVFDPSFIIEIFDTTKVPHFDDSYLTFDNLDAKTKKCKRLESCVLYVDIRNSAALSTEKQPKTLSKIYSAFVRSMIKVAKYNNGHVRNIIGDRVMVIFDQEKCFTNALETAIVMNSVAQYIIDKHYSGEFKCGIGIDYGKMLVTKAGQVRRGTQTEFYRSFVWLGRPANIASRLTDLANKSITSTNGAVYVGRYYQPTNKWLWFYESYQEFLGDLEETQSRVLRHKDPYFHSFLDTIQTSTISYQPILMTSAVYEGYKKENPQGNSIKRGWWKKQVVDIKEYKGDVYGGDVYKKVVEDL